MESIAGVLQQQPGVDEAPYQALQESTIRIYLARSKWKLLVRCKCYINHHVQHKVVGLRLPQLDVQFADIDLKYH